MANPSAKLLQHAIGAAGVDASSVNDRDVLARFADAGDHAAFATLVRRHSGMVLGVCRRTLPTVQDAEDACQATFLLPARKAKSTRWQPSVANWLYTTARRVAQNATVAAKRRQKREGRAAVPEAIPPVDRMTGRELLAVLDRELDRLPPIYREPLVLCYLEGLTHEEVAARLGIAPPTVKVRIHRGRKRLHAALTHRGATLGAGLLALAATSPTEASPARLGEAILAAATGTPPAAVYALARGAAANGVANKLLITALALVGVAALGAAVWSKNFVPVIPSATTPAVLRPISPVRELEPVEIPLINDPDKLPSGAVARLGSLRFRHSNMLWAIAYTPDGKHIASASSDRTIRLWDSATGKEVRRITCNTNAGLSLAISADGKTLASPGDNDTLRVLDLATNRELFNVRAHEGSAVFCVAFSPDGQTVASGGGGNGHRTLILWHVPSGKELHVLGDKKGTITTVAFSPDGKTLAAAGPDLDLWDVATGKLICRLTGHHRWVSSLAFSPDGKTLFSGSHDDTIREWDVTTGQELRQLHGEGGISPHRYGGGPVQSIPFHDSGVHSVALSRDGKLLASGGFNGSVKLWDAASGKELFKIQALSREVKSLAFSPDGKTLATAGFDYVIHLWDTTTGKQRLPSTGHDSEVHFATFSRDGRHVASIAHDRTIRVWDTSTGHELQVLRGHEDYVACAAFSADGRTIISGDERGKLKFWDVATGREVRELWDVPPAMRLLRRGHVTSVAISPDGKLLASGSCGSGGEHCLNSVRLWYAASGREVRTLKEEPNAQNGFLDVEFLADGKCVAARGFDAVVVLDASTGKELRRFNGRDTMLRDGRVLMLGDDSRLRLLDAATGKEIGRFDAPPKPVRQFACSPDGRTIAWLVLWDKRTGVELFEVATGQVRRRFEGHAGPVTALAFSPDGKMLVTASQDTTLLVWDVKGANATTK